MALHRRNCEFLFVPLAGSVPAAMSISMPDGSCVVRRVVDSDNSCLFNAVGYMVEHSRSRAPELRQVRTTQEGWMSCHALSHVCVPHCCRCCCFPHNIKLLLMKGHSLRRACLQPASHPPPAGQLPLWLWAPLLALAGLGWAPHSLPDRGLLLCPCAQVIADVVRADPVTYNEGFLGKDNAEYCTWILQPDK